MHMHDMYDACLPASRLKPCAARPVSTAATLRPDPAPTITSAVLLRRAGILNTIGGAYCIKAKSAIAAMQSNGGGAAATAVPVAAQAVPAQAAPNKI